MRVSVMALALGATLLVSAGGSQQGNAASGQPSANHAEMQFMRMVNTERERRGMKPLAWDTTLAQASRSHSQEMADLEYFDHESPVPGRRTPADRWERLVPNPPNAYTIAENLFYGTQPDVAWGHRELMESQDHRANILNGGFSKVGVGVHMDQNGEMWVTEMFLS